MKCVDPYTPYGGAFPCGKCDICRNRMKSERATRIELEAREWPSNVFVTLTYRDETMPWTTADGTGVPTLVPLDTQLFMKRLLKDASATFQWKQRFWLTGEYGDRTWRPHYHAAFFNFPCCQRGDTLRSQSGRYLWLECCAVCRMVGYAWKHGDVGIGNLGPDRARYLGGYIEKKLNKGGDARLDGRHPEFSRQSRGGSKAGSCGIGGSAVASLVAPLNRYQAGEVPSTVRIAGKVRPLGRYMRSKMRELMDVDTVAEEATKAMVWETQVLPMREAAAANGTTIKEEFRKANEGLLATLRLNRENYKARRKGREL